MLRHVEALHERRLRVHQSWMRAAEIFIETPRCIFASTRDPDIRAQAGLAKGVLPGSGAIVPIARRTRSSS
jgi:hypothetical protein